MLPLWRKKTIKRILPFLQILFVSALILACGRNPASELLLQAGDALRDGNVEEALSFYQKITTLYPHTKASQEAFYWTGEVHRLFKNQPKEAIALFRKAVSEGRITRYGEKAQKRIADIYYRDLKEFKKAIPEFQRLIDQFQGSTLSGEAQYQIGQCYMALGEYEQARIEYSILIDRYGESPFRDAAAYRTGVADFRKGDFQEARQSYEDFIARYGESPLVLNARLGLADTFSEIGEIDEALNQLAALEKDYPNKEIILRKVDSLLKTKKSRERGKRSKR